MTTQAAILQFLRDRAKMSQAELARQSGVSRSRIQRHENGQLVRISDAVRYARALGLEPQALDDMLQGRTPPPWTGDPVKAPEPSQIAVGDILTLTVKVLAVRRGPA